MSGLKGGEHYNVTTIGEKGGENAAMFIALREANATRQPCRYCGVRCLPATLARHEALCADDD